MSYKFDHRQLADEMELYFFDESIGAGLPVWLPNGVVIRDELERFIKDLERKQGYQRVVSPHIAKSDLYESSGHLRCFHENMFPPMRWPEDNSQYYLRPMNCPHHHKAFASSPRSYRDLPLRLAEYGQVYRYENSGSLRGLSRVRGLCQNDAHIYVDPSNVRAEVEMVLNLHEHCYKVLGLKGYRYRLSKKDPNRSEDFDGPAELWSQGEQILRECLLAKGLPFFEAEGEAAFYGPKIDVQMKMGSGQEESIASVQLDFNSAEKFDLRFIASSGEEKRPWIIHRAPLGSHERFVSLLLEYYDGQLPAWLSPIQIYLIPINDKEQKYCDDLAKAFLEKGIRAVVDRRLGSLSKRILFAHRLRPFSKVIVGPREVEKGLLEVQLRNEKVVVPPEQIAEVLKSVADSPDVHKI